MANKSFTKPVENKSPLSNIIGNKPNDTVKNNSSKNLGATSLIDSLPNKSVKKVEEKITTIKVNKEDWEKFKEVADNIGYSRTELINLFIKDAVNK